MFRKRLSTLTLCLSTLCLAGNLAASTLASSNSLSVLGYSYGTPGSVYSDWANTLNGLGPLGDGPSFIPSAGCGDPTIGCASSFFSGTPQFGITGVNSSASSGYQGSASFPMVITMPNLTAFTGLSLQLSGNVIVTLNLSDNSTVTTGPVNLASQNLITFTSPLQIISARIDSSGGTFLFSDLTWGTADPSKLPTQPAPGPGDSGSQSAVPEVSTLLLMGGGLFGLSRLTKKRNHPLNF